MRVFSPGWVPTLIVLPILALTLNLGFWQLRRADEKQSLLDSWTATLSSPALPLDEAQSRLTSELPSKAQVHGFWVTEPSMVWENRSFQERPGIHQLQWFETSTIWVLIDRGWTAQKAAPMAGAATIVGQLLIPEPAWRKPVLPEGSVPELSFPVLDLPTLAQKVPQGKQTAPYLLRLSSDSVGVLTPVGQQHAVMPVRHRGYAFTWFSLSAAIVLLFLKWSFRKAKKV